MLQIVHFGLIKTFINPLWAMVMGQELLELGLGTNVKTLVVPEGIVGIKGNDFKG
jgi:hypothetical protein